MEHEVGHRNQDHSFTGFRPGLVVLGQSAVLAQPREGAFDDPALGQHDEAMRFGTLDDLHKTPVPASRPVDKPPGIAAVGKDQLQSAKPRTQLLNDESAAVAVLKVGRMDDQSHDQTKRVDEDVTLAPAYLLARVVTAVPPFSAVLTVWLSRMPTLGVGIFPAFRRTCARSRS